MRVESLIALVLIAPFFSHTYGQDAAPAMGAQRSERSVGWHERSVAGDKDAFYFDIVQRTCALYVALRSGAFKSPVEFGRDVDDTMVHWNMCPGGTMVACVAPAANGDTTRVGIPWPY